MRTLAGVLAFALMTAAPALAQAPPLKIVGGSKKVTFNENRQVQTYFRIEPGKSLKLATNGSMLLLVPARPLIGVAGQAKAEILVSVGAPGKAPQTYRETLTDQPPMVTLSDGTLASGPKVLRIPIESASAMVEISTSSEPGAIVGFARAPLPKVATPKATPVPIPMPGMPMPGATPKVAMPMPMPMPGGGGTSTAATSMPMPGGAGVPAPVLVPTGPLIRRKVERLSLGPKVAAVVPAGSVSPPGGGDLSNLYLGAEMRFTFPVLERRFSIGAEAGQYTLRDVENAYATTPFGATLETEVEVSTRVTPILAGAQWKMKMGGDRRAVFFGAAGGPVLTSRTETVTFRDPVQSEEMRFGAQGRLGFEQKLGPGRAVIEASWIHVTESAKKDETSATQTIDPYLGGALLGLQYRFVF